MSDMSAVIIAKSDQVNADDLLSGPITITIKEVKVRVGEEQPVSINFGDPKKVFRPCKTVARVMVAAWGPDSSKYVGKSMTLYRDPSVTWGGLAVGGIRCSHMSNIDKTMTVVLKETRKNSKPVIIHPLTVEKRQEPKSEPAKVDALPPMEDGDLTFADRWDMAVDEATVAADLHRDFSAAMKTAEWDALKDADPGRATKLKEQVTARVAELKGSGS